jgi:hypothetical protein
MAVTLESISDADRTTATGLYNLAESYRHAADRVRASKATPLRFESPIRFLYYHAIELYLKSCLRGDGLDPEIITSRYGHRFVKLRKACSTRGASFDDEDIATIKMIDGDNYWRSRYIKTGFVSDASLGAVARTCNSLAYRVFAFLRSRQVLLHKPKATPPRLRRN